MRCEEGAHASRLMYKSYMTVSARKPDKAGRLVTQFYLEITFARSYSFSSNSLGIFKASRTARS